MSKNEIRSPVGCSTGSSGKKRRADASWGLRDGGKINGPAVLSYALLGALTVSLLFNFGVIGGSLFGFGAKQTTVNVAVANDFSVEIWDPVGAEYVEDPDYFPNAIYLVFFYIDGKFIDLANQAFADNESAILDEDILENGSLGYGFMIYELPLATPGNESIEGLTYGVSLDNMIIVPSFGLLITNTTDDFTVEGGLENHSLFVEALFTETMNKTVFDELVGDIYYDGVFNIVLTGCRYYHSPPDPDTSRIFAEVNGVPTVFEEDFFVSP